ncbi:MAG: hypothetical protein ABW198_10125 [Pseudorhodoplanes sp.]
MQKIDLDALSIEELATLRDNATARLAERIHARRKELQTELTRLATYDRDGKDGKAKGKAASSAPKLVKESVRQALKEPAKDDAAKAA